MIREEVDWFKMSSGIYSDPDIQRLSDKAFRYWINAVAWCRHHDTDGLYQFAGRAPKQIAELVAAHRFRPTDDPFAYVIVGWEKWQISNEETGKHRRQTRDRVAKHRGDITDGVTRYNRVTGSGSNELPLISSALVSSGVGGAGGGGFEAWYAVYPLHVGRKKAEESYDRAIRHGIDPGLLVAAAQAYRDSPRRKPDYTAHPATWLNQERWNDDPRSAEPDRMANVIRLAREMEDGMGDAG